MNSSSLPGQIRRRPYVIIVLFLIGIDVFLASITYAHHSKELRVVFFDVGQGDAVLIEAPNGNQLLYDAGPPSGAILRKLSHELPFWDHTIDVAVLSHPDADHIGGFPDVLKRYEVSAVLTSGAHSDNGVHDATEQAILDEHAAHITARKGMSIELGDGVVADVLYPDRDTSNMETNSASIVLRVRYGETAFLLSGDLPQREENTLTRMYGEHMHAQVLKIGHHGSRTSTSAGWLAAVEPAGVVISAGKDNRYGHPHKEVLTLLERLHIPHVETSTSGDIVFESDGKIITRK